MNCEMNKISDTLRGERVVKILMSFMMNRERCKNK